MPVVFWLICGPFLTRPVVFEAKKLNGLGQMHDLFLKNNTKLTQFTEARFGTWMVPSQFFNEDHLKKKGNFPKKVQRPPEKLGE